MRTLRYSVLSALLLIGSGLAPALSLEGGDGPRSAQTTGGAPSPEIDAMLGLALAGGVVAFLRRRKTNRAKSTI